MVILPQPMESDTDNLLSGAPGRFAEAILKAMQIEPHEAYLASALPAPLSLPDWPELASRGLGEVTRRHISLAKPHRVIAFDRSLASIFGVKPEMAREPAAIEAGGNTLPLLLAPTLAELARSAQRRRNFWDRWLEWTA